MQLITIILLVLVATASAENQESIRKSKATRIVNGAEVVPHSIPWQAHIKFSDAENMVRMCGGSLINQQWILTAAHCIKNSILSDVLLGAHNISEEWEVCTLMRSKEFIVHEDYDSVTLKNDIALIKLPEPIEFNENIQPISLNSEDNVDDMEATISGWGDRSDNMANVSHVLRSIDVHVMPHSKCEASYNTPKSKICTKSGAGDVKSACYGDSGGPLVVDMKSQIGVASAVALGCESGFPNVFTRVSYYIDWINEKIA